MKSRLLFLFTLVSILASQVSHAFPFYSGYYLGNPYGYGMFGYTAYTGYYPGYSYYSYFQFQPRYATFGAIAYSRSLQTGAYAWGAPDRWTAETKAVQQCGAADCESVVWVQGGCAAVAIDRDHRGIFWGYAVDKLTAKDAAVTACRQSEDTHFCAAKLWVCSF